MNLQIKQNWSQKPNPQQKLKQNLAKSQKNQKPNESITQYSKRFFKSKHRFDKSWRKFCKITQKFSRIEEPTESEDELGIREQFFWLVILLNGARFFVITAIGFTEFSDEDGAWRFANEDFVDDENEDRRFWWMFDILFRVRESENLRKRKLWVLMAKESDEVILLLGLNNWILNFERTILTVDFEVSICLGACTCLKLYVCYFSIYHWPVILCHVARHCVTDSVWFSVFLNSNFKRRDKRWIKIRISNGHLWTF